MNKKVKDTILLICAFPIIPLLLLATGFFSSAINMWSGWRAIVAIILVTFAGIDFAICMILNK